VERIRKRNMENRAGQLERIEKDIADHIFANSPQMLALCLTVIGLIKIYASLQRITTLTDDCLAFCVIAFLVSTVGSYLALRAATPKRRFVLGRIADVSFLAGLGCAAIVAVMITYTLAG
jgi:hypothetical protein